MEAIFAITLGVLTASGLYLVLRARTFSVVMGLTLVSYAVSLFLLAMGRLATGKPPVIAHGQGPSAAFTDYADPLPQALVLTAIVISFAMTAFSIVLSLRSLALTGSDHVDGREAAEKTGAAAPGKATGQGADKGADRGADKKADIR
jgi:multicomponent K+:H+ antiporter subunit C